MLENTKEDNIYSANKGYKTTWGKYPCSINDNMNIVRMTDKPIKIYNPFDFYYPSESHSLHIKFASINTSNTSEILNFINEFGFLGLDIKERKETLEKQLGQIIIEIYKHSTKKESMFDDSERLISTLKNACNLTINHDVSEAFESIHEESVERISLEVDKFRGLLILIENKDNTTAEELYKLIFNASDAYHQTFFEMDYGSYKNDTNKLRLEANNCIIYRINDELSLVTPSIDITVFDNNKFQPQWKTNTLISALYTMLYLDLIQGKEIRQCKNPTCHNFFDVYGNYRIKKFCTKRCAQAKASRNYRKRQKKKSEEV